MQWSKTRLRNPASSISSGVVVAMHRGEILALLGENAVALKIAIQTEIAENVERVINVFERAAEFVSAVAPSIEILRRESLAAVRDSLRRAIPRNCARPWRA